MNREEGRIYGLNERVKGIEAEIWCW